MEAASLSRFISPVQFHAVNTARYLHVSTYYYCLIIRGVRNGDTFYGPFQRRIKYLAVFERAIGKEDYRFLFLLLLALSTHLLKAFNSN